MMKSLDFQVVFEAVVGNGYLSDIAIDDVKMSASCPPPGEFRVYNHAFAHIGI